MQQILYGKERLLGWLRNRMEFGLHALGNKNILVDPRFSNIHQRINQKVKLRETFRPFAPAVLGKDCYEYFNLKAKFPYMLFVSYLIICSSRYSLVSIAISSAVLQQPFFNPERMRGSDFYICN